MSDQTGIKANNLLKNKKVELSRKSHIEKVKLEKNSIETHSPTPQYYVLPAGGMHLAVPDLEFHNGHFANSSESLASHSTSLPNEFKEKPQKDRNSNSSKMTSVGGLFSKKESLKGSKLPFVLEITAGPGQKKMEKSRVKKTPPPSQTLFESAAFIKSYFTFSQDKDPPDKEAASDNEESVKNKVMGLWHNMKYGWSANMKTNFSRDTPIYLLGRVYHKTFKEEQSYGDTRFLCSNIEGFKKDFTSLGWFTYRRKFPPLPESNLTTDCGWGCMIRSGQMMMQTALRRHFLLCNWRYDSGDGPQESIHKQIMKFFCDDPSPNCPFSLHNLILFGHKMNKKAGNWYGPSCVAHMFKDAVEEASKHIPALERIGVYIAQDGAVYVQDILDMCSVGRCLCKNPPSDGVRTGEGLERNSPVLREPDKQRGSTVLTSDGHYPVHCEVNGKSLYPSLESYSDAGLSSSVTKSAPGNGATVPLDLYVDLNREKEDKMNNRPFGDAVTMRLRESSPEEERSDVAEESCPQCMGWKSCVIFIPVRLGGVSMNPIYRNCIYSLFLHDLCIGIIGGRPKHSLYFVGFQDESLIHLDPHLNQDAVPFESYDFPLETYHCVSPRKLNISKMDPSATIGFYCHTRSQFYRLLEEAPLIAIARDGNMDSPIFEFVDGRSKDVNGWLEETLTIVDTPRMSFSGPSPTETPPSSTPAEDASSTSTDQEQTEELVFD